MIGFNFEPGAKCSLSDASFGSVVLCDMLEENTIDAGVTTTSKEGDFSFIVTNPGGLSWYFPMANIP